MEEPEQELESAILTIVQERIKKVKIAANMNAQIFTITTAKLDGLSGQNGELARQLVEKV